MFGGDDDDIDFTPSNSSKLASLFGLEKPAIEKSSSLTYVAPKQPKKAQSDTLVHQKGEGGEQSSSKLEIICAKAVSAFKLEEGKYVEQGRVGAAILGNQLNHVYQLLLYKGQKQHITFAKITLKFQFQVQANNYASFYNDKRQNWSLRFDSTEDFVAFTKEVGLAKLNSAAGILDAVLVQDLLPGEGSRVENGDAVEIRYIGWIFKNGKFNQVFDDNLKSDKALRVKVGKGKLVQGWEEGLLGSRKGSKRLIVIPASLGYGAKGKEGVVPPNSVLAFEFDVSRVKQHKDKESSRSDTPVFTEEFTDNAVPPNVGTDENTIKARGASISEALTSSPRSHKASIISRMAKMGQPTLLLPGAVACNPSDSEDNEEEVSGTASPPTISNASVSGSSSTSKPPSVSQVQSRESSPHPTVNKVCQPSASAGALQKVAAYPSEPWQRQEFLQNSSSVGMKQVHRPESEYIPSYPVQPAYTLTNQPLAIHSMNAQTLPISTVPQQVDMLPVFFSESRTHNSEVRMAVNKVIDKVDQISTKMDHVLMNHHQNPAQLYSSGFHASSPVRGLEPSEIVFSIQKLVTENESLKEELKEKTEKLSAQNEKMYELLNQSQKYIERSTNMLEQRSETLQTNAANSDKLVSLEREKVKLNNELGEAMSSISELQMQVNEFQKKEAELNTSIESFQMSIRNLEKDLSSKNELEKEHCTKIEHLEMLVKQVEHQKETLSTRIEELLESRNQELSKQAFEEYNGSKELEKIKDLEAKDAEISSLQAQITQLTEKLRVMKSKSGSTPSSSSSDVVATVKQVMNRVYHSLQSEFLVGQEYTGQDIRQTLMTTIRDVTLQLLEIESDAEMQSASAPKAIEVNENDKVVAAPPEHSINTSVETKEDTSAQGYNNSSDMKEESSNKQDDPLGNGEPGKSVGTVETVAVPKPEEIAREGSEECTEVPGAIVEDKIESDSVRDNVDDNNPISTEEMKNSTSEKKEEQKSRASSLERGWRPQPPPPPLFDDDDDDDDWLN